MSRLPPLKSLPEVPPQFAGQIFTGSVIQSEKFKTPTFTFVTRDNRFSIQYYHDWRAPSEKDNIDAYLTICTTPTLYYHPDTQQTTLFCRDPRIGPGRLDLYILLYQTDEVNIKAKLMTHERYFDLGRFQQAYAACHAQKLYGLTQAKATKIRNDMRRYTSEITRITGEFRTARTVADDAVRTTMAERYAESQRIWQNSIVEEGPWTPELLWEITDCESRGDLERVQELVLWRQTEKRRAMRRGS